MTDNYTIIVKVQFGTAPKSMPLWRIVYKFVVEYGSVYPRHSMSSSQSVCIYTMLTDN